MAAVLAQWVNSYKRLVPGYEAPVYVAWSQRNRSALIRVPLYKPGSSRRHAPRSGAPTGVQPVPRSRPCCTSRAGGVERGTSCRRRCGRTSTGSRPTSAASAGSSPLPESLGEAIEELAGSELMQRALGEHIFPRYVELKRKEWDEYRVQTSAGRWRVTGSAVGTGGRGHRPSEMGGVLRSHSSPGTSRRVHCDTPLTTVRCVVAPRYDIPKAAPEPLRLVQSFVNTGRPSARTRVARDAGGPVVVVGRGGLTDAVELTASDVQRAIEYEEALRALLRANNGDAVAVDAIVPPSTGLLPPARLAVELDDARRVRIELRPRARRRARSGSSASR